MTHQSGLTLIERAANFLEQTAIITTASTFNYRQLLAASGQVATYLLAGAEDLAEARVAFLVPPGFDYVAIQWGIWRAGGIAMPLAISHPTPELAYVIEDAAATIVVAHPDLADRVQPVAEAHNLRFALSSALFNLAETTDAPLALPHISPARRGMILYTSGTTGKPKGVVSTHQNIEAQVTSLVKAWDWQADDHILHILPLHHCHGIINVLTCALWSGATCEMLPRFEAEEVWRRFCEADLTLFMAVPTIYARLIAFWESASPKEQQIMSAACTKFRLMVSGSAALPVSVLEKWQAISGHILLERYGMTEMGMALSNPLHGERRPGHVGLPLPGVEIRLVDEAGEVVTAPDTPGQIQVKGPNVFGEYWSKPKATTAAFEDGWFCTGDIAVLREGAYRILGRNSVDIIKTGGYKVSALEIEETLRTHPVIQECAVVGVTDPEWGERVCAALVTQAGADLSLNTLRTWCKARLAPYKSPSRILLVEALPRNAMGKVTKPQVKILFQD